MCLRAWSAWPVVDPQPAQLMLRLLPLCLVPPSLPPSLQVALDEEAAVFDQGGAALQQ